MFNASAGPKPFDPGAPRTYDFGNDDYLDPSADLAVTGKSRNLRWWTVNLSRFVCPRSTADRTQPDCSRRNAPQY